MSRYTTELRYIVEMACKDHDVELSGVDSNCRNAAPYIFNFNFPIWDENERLNFEVMFLKRFYPQEICAETVGLWKVFLEEWLIVNMPYWNNLINAFIKMSDIDNLLNTQDSEIENYHGSRNDKNDGTYDKGMESLTKDNGTSSADSMDKYYEIPSNNITSIDNHLNNARQINANNSAQNTRDYNDTINSNYTDNKNMNDEHHLGRKYNKGLNINDTLLKYMDGLNNIYRKMFDTMEELFMGVY